MIECSFIKTDNPSELSRSFQRSILTWKLDKDVNSDDISISHNGKPELKECRNIHFNTSHTLGGMICAVGFNELGVDIEYLRRANLSIANRFFHEQEKQWVFDKPEEIDLRFTQIWTRKEAYIKAYGHDVSFLGPHYNVLDLRGMSTFSYNGFIISIYIPGIKKTNYTLNEIHYNWIQNQFRKQKTAIPIYPVELN